MVYFNPLSRLVEGPSVEHDDAMSDDSDAAGFMFAILSEQDSADRVLAEQLVAGFIMQLTHDEDEEDGGTKPFKIAMAMGAALALQCYEEPRMTARLLEVETDPSIISRLGAKVAHDISEAHEAAHRVQRLVAGMPLSEVAAMVDTLKENGDTRGSRADVVRMLENALLENKVDK